MSENERLPERGIEPQNLHTAFDVATWTAFKSLFRLLERKGIVEGTDLRTLEYFAEQEVERIRARGEVHRVAAAQIVVDWFGSGARDDNG